MFMKKTLLFCLGGLLAVSAHGQQAEPTQQAVIPAVPTLSSSDDNLFQNGVAQRVTGLSDTLYFGSSYQFSGPYSNIALDRVAPLDSGFLYGMNAAGYKGFAQLYRYANIDLATPQDTTYNILGLLARFNGTKSATSTKSAVFTVWKRDTNKYPVTNRPKVYVYGEPLAATVATKTVPFSAINLGASTVSYFATPITGINYDVYCGYTIAYNFSTSAGDSIGLASTQTAGTNIYSIEAGTGDTLLNARNLIQTSAGVWRSIVYDFTIGNGGDQVIYPIIKLSCTACHPSAVNGLTKNGLTFFGNYPNPAVANTNIRFGLKSKADVTIQVLDISGRALRTIRQTGLANGEHIINVETASLPAGNYVYTIETSEGDVMASQMTVAK